MMLEGYTTSLYVHSMYEDNVLFPTVDLYLPGRMKTAEMQHEQIHHDEEVIQAAQLAARCILFLSLMIVGYQGIPQGN